MNTPPPLKTSRPSLLDHLAHAALLRALTTARAEGMRPLCIDGTAGNGHDALFLAESAPEGSLVVAFDVRPEAVAATEARLEAAREARLREGKTLPARWRCLHMGHECMETALRELAPEEDRPLMAAVFNFGWLPGSDKRHATRAETSLRAVEIVLERLAPCGCLCLHCYTGHPGGAEEEAVLRERLALMPPRRWRVFYGRDINRTTDDGRPRHESLLLAERLPAGRKSLQVQGAPSASRLA